MAEAAVPQASRAIDLIVLFAFDLLYLNGYTWASGRCSSARHIFKKLFDGTDGRPQC
jgi:ATP-dependent DNA ligase